MRFEEREYQTKCVDAWYSDLKAGNNSLVAVPTGAGKTVILCKLLVKWFEEHPESNVLVLSHTQEIVEQDYHSLLEYFPKFGVGIYSAGLGEKKVRKITVGGIQSVYRKPEKFYHCNLVIVDEVHSVNHKDEGMYRSLIGNMNGAALGGMSATVFRTGFGYIYQGKNTLFNTLAYDLSSVGSFNRLVKEGYLTKLISKAPENEMDSTGVKKSAGDYNLKELAKKHDRSYVTERIVAELVKDGEKYKKWLVFAIDIAHCEHVHEELLKHGIDAKLLHSKMEYDREKTINDFKNGSLRALVSVGMVTTGFDSPNVDLIALLRPTLSPVLHVQMVGRGLRVAPGKDHCLVLDYAGNTERLGPINNPVVRGKQKSDSGGGEAPTKKCPSCRTITFAIARFCDVCGHEFQFEHKLKLNPTTRDIVQKSDGEWLTVDDVTYHLHYKPGKPVSLKVSYVCGMQVVSEWVCLNHSGYAKQKADYWVRRRLKQPVELTSESVYRHSHELKTPKQIRIKRDKYVTIVNQKF